MLKEDEKKLTQSVNKHIQIINKKMQD